MTVLVTGAAGFIGSYTVERLLKEGHNVVGIDNINNYYTPELKYARLTNAGIERTEIEDYKPVQSTSHSNYIFIKCDITDREFLPRLFKQYLFTHVINLAAQAGVRYSIENPWAYLDSNITGFLNILECCRHYPVEHLVYASSSSVYGGNTKTPFSEDDKVDNPVSLYAATKKSNELMAACYAKLYDIPCTGLRFFTVYGPWGRPDMAPMLFTKNIELGNEIKVFNNGNLMRDFTFIDDIVEGVWRVTCKSPKHIDPMPNALPHKVYNIGCGHPINLMDFISTLERELGKEAKKRFLPMQAGDVNITFADTTLLERDYQYKPIIDLTTGIHHLVEWWRALPNKFL